MMTATLPLLGGSLQRLLIGTALLLISLSGCGGRETTRNPESSDPAVAVSPLDADKVPADLRDLVPLAQRWGIGDDVDRSERIRQATAAEKSELRAAFGPRQARITAWLDSFGQGPMPDEAAAFMYTQLAIEEMP
jgi:hypothetical protein